MGTGQTEAMRIDTTGNVGINTNDPAYKLDVSASYSTTLPTFRTGTFTIQPYGKNNVFFTENSYFTGTVWTKPLAGYASGIQFFEGQILFPSNGTSDAGTFTPVRSMKVDPSDSGTVAIGGDINSARGNYTGAKMVVFGTGNVTIGGTTNPLGRFDVNGGSGTYVNVFNMYGAGTGSVFGRIANTDKSKVALIALSETSGDVATPFYIERYGSTHASTPNLVNIYNANNAALQLYTNSKKMITLSANGDIVLGAGATDYDQVLKFDGQSNDGIITWMEDEDYFEFADDIKMTNNETILLGGTGFVDSPKYKAGGTDPVADGTYTVGIGTTTNGTITIKGGIITAVQQAS
jgi:hypothetical protein